MSVSVVPIAAPRTINRKQPKIYRPSGPLTPPLHTGTVCAANAAQAAKNHDVVFSGEDGAFMSGTGMMVKLPNKGAPPYCQIGPST